MQLVAGQLTVHADRASSMTSKSVAWLLSDLGVTKTHPRPHVSNDNPYSEAQFKTLKYCPELPDRFGGIEILVSDIADHRLSLEVASSRVRVSSELVPSEMTPAAGDRGVRG